VIDGRESIVQEIADTPALRSYLAEQFRALLETPAFLDALPGYLLPDVSSQGAYRFFATESSKWQLDPVKAPQAAHCTTQFSSLFLLGVRLCP